MKTTILSVLLFFSLLSISNAQRIASRTTGSRVFNETRRLVSKMSTNKINGSYSVGCLRKGSKVYFRTDKGRIGRMEILSTGKDFKANIITFDVRSGYVVAQKNNFQIRATFNYDLDNINEAKSSIDFWWQMGYSNQRFIVPRSGARFYTTCSHATPNTPYLPLLRNIKYYESRMSTRQIDGSNNSRNQLKTGTGIYYRTNEGRYGSMTIRKYGKDLIISCTTINPDGSLYRRNSQIKIKPSWTLDLDKLVLGQGSRDLWWKHFNNTNRYLESKGGAKFYIYSRK